MQNIVSHFMLLAKRWWWVVILGVVLCGGITYAISKKTHTVYRATAILIVNFQTSTSSNDSVTASLEAVPTYSQLITSPIVLQPILTQHPGMTLKQLSAMITVTPKPTSQLIEVDVDNANPTLAKNIANEISDQFVQYINPQLAATVLPVYAVQPVDPIRPHPLQDGAVGAVVGLGLALALIFIFEWFDDRLGGPEDVQDLLGMDTLAIIPQLSRRERKKTEEAPALAEACRMLCASLDAAQANRPFKLVMVTSALAGEGKSMVAAKLASSLALTGKQVLLVDADLRRPVQYQHFHLDNSYGLSRTLVPTYTQGRVEPQSQPTDIPTLRVLTAGIPSSHSAEMLQSPLANQLFEYFKKAPFDYILFDTPPLLPVADAQFLASRVHATVLVVDASKTPRKVLLRAKRVFNRTPTILLGVAINKSRWPESGYIREYQKNVQLSSSRMNGSNLPPNTLPAHDREDTSASETSVNNIANTPTMVIPSIDGEIDIDIPTTSPTVSKIGTTVPETLPVDGEANTAPPGTSHVDEEDSIPVERANSDITITLRHPIWRKPIEEQ